MIVNMKYICRITYTTILLLQLDALIPTTFPSGKPKIFTFDKSARSRDLSLFSPQRTKFIAKHWENNILNGGLEIRKEDKHIIEGIDELYDIIDTTDTTDTTDRRILYISWSPLGAIREVLFLVVVEIDAEEKKFIVRLVLQSPFWEPKQIESCHLKYALEDLVNGIDNVTLDLSQLYRKNKRISLSWMLLDKKCHNNA